jgi:CRP/FNR family transcriptional regulator
VGEVKAAADSLAPAVVSAAFEFDRNLADHEPSPSPEVTLVFRSSLLHELFGDRPVESFAVNAVLFREDDLAHPHYVFEIVNGCVRLQRNLNDGRRSIVGFLFEGDVVGGILYEQHRFSAEAVTPVEVRRLSRRQLMTRMSEKPNLNAEFLALTRRTLFQALQHVVLLGRMTARQKIATFLLGYAGPVASETSNPTIELPMKRLDIADYLGLTIESVSRELTRFKRDGVVATAGSHRIEIISIEALKDAAESFGRKGGDLPALAIHAHHY